MRQELDKKTLYKYGKMYFTDEITMGRFAELFEMSPTKASQLLNSLHDDPEFNMIECVRILEKKRGLMVYKPKPRDKPLDPPKWKAVDRKTAFSKNEEDYGYGQWMFGKERKALVNAGMMFKEFLEFVGNKIINKEKE